MNPEIALFSNLLIYLVGFVVLFVAKKNILSAFTDWLAISVVVLGVIFASSVQEHFYDGQTFNFNWIKIGSFKNNFSFLLDSQAYFMYVLVQVIGLLVIVFSSKYLKNDASKNRFYAYILLFIGAMIGLVLSGNLLQFYMFWEMVGLCSFLLVGFWYKKAAVKSASFKAFIINRLGDLFLLVGIFILYFVFNTFNFSDLEKIEINTLTKTQILNLNIAIMLVFGGVMSKSAQLPLHIWLPRAMVGPTPASALIHAATMVVAGIFLLGRLNPLFTEEVRWYIAGVGSLTVVFGGLAAIFQNDLKAILAFSTISQLGYMVTAMGLGAVGAAYFHLSTHAFFKAGLFLGAGVIIEYFHHEQDIRKMGGLQKKLPLVFLFFLVCGASLCGVPFTSGFLSKDAIIMEALEKSNFFTPSFKIIIPLLLLFGSFLTALYFIRVLVMVFFERDESQIQKIISGTKRTLFGAKKSFENILTGEKQSGDTSYLNQILKEAGVYEISLGVLALASIFFVFSKNAFSVESVWFLEVFKHESSHNNWVVWLLLFFLFLAILISYNTTDAEIRSFYMEKKLGNKRKTFFKTIKEGFYLEHFYAMVFRYFFVKYNSEGIHVNQLGLMPKISSKFESKFLDELIKVLITGCLKCAMFFNALDNKIFDFLINGISELALKASEGIKNFQKNNLQYYLLTGILGLLVLAIFKFIG